VKFEVPEIGRVSEKLWDFPMGVKTGIFVNLPLEHGSTAEHCLFDWG
jgi:hypothetical protein